jgi:hypothetical protein
MFGSISLIGPICLIGSIGLIGVVGFISLIGLVGLIVLLVEKPSTPRRRRNLLRPFCAYVLLCFLLISIDA